MSVFETDDLALATALILHNFDPTCEHRQVFNSRAGKMQRRHFWRFVAEPDLLSHVDDYRDGVLDVEPREFARVLADVRKSMADRDPPGNERWRRHFD